MGKIHYEIEIEVIQGEGCAHHHLGEKFRYPDDVGKIYPWLLDSVNAMVRVLQFGGTLPWKYAGTPYEKMHDVEGITTEYVRCPDPTGAGVVVKITRRPLAAPEEVGWS